MAEIQKNPNTPLSDEDLASLRKSLGIPDPKDMPDYGDLQDPNKPKAEIQMPSDGIIPPSGDPFKEPSLLESVSKGAKTLWNDNMAYQKAQTPQEPPRVDWSPSALLSKKLGVGPAPTDQQDIKTVEQNAQQAPSKPGFFAQEGNVLKHALSTFNPLSIVGGTLNNIAAIGGERTKTGAPVQNMSDNPESLIGLVKQSLAMSPLAYGGWDVVAPALGLGNLYSTQPGMQGQQTVQQAPQPQEEVRTNYLNIHTPTSVPSGPSATADAVNQKYNTQMINIDQAARMAINKNPQARLEIQKQVQELKKQAIDTQNAELAQLKTTKERQGDLGNVVQGSDDYKELTNKSNTLKKMDSVVADLEEAKNSGDVKSVGAIGTELIGFLNKVQGSVVTEEQRKNLNPLIQDVKGFFGMGAGTVINPTQYPVMLRTIKAIRSELVNDLNSSIEKPGNEIPADKQAWLFNNEIKETSEKVYAPKVSVGSKDYALGFNVDSEPVLIDPKTHYTYAIGKNDKGALDINKIEGIEMKSGRLAEERSKKLFYKDSNEEVPPTDRVATSLPMAPQYIDYNAYGFPKPDKKNSIAVKKLTSNGDTFEAVYNRAQVGDDKRALDLMAARTMKDLESEGKLEAAKTAGVVGGAGKALKNVPVIGDLLSGVGDTLSQTGAGAVGSLSSPPNYKFRKDQDVVKEALGLKKYKGTDNTPPPPFVPSKKPGSGKPWKQ